MNLRHLFLTCQAQTSPAPFGIEIDRAEGVYMYGPDGKRYIDLVAGVSVSNVGHCHPDVVEAVNEQVSRYMHLMVYGEFIQSPQVLYAAKLVALLPENLSNVYFVNSGSEANEGALKLAKRFTGRQEIIGFRNAYHGGTHGVLSLTSDECFRHAFRPLLPDVRLLDFNNFDHLSQISERTACVIAEPMQGEAGAIVPETGFLQSLRQRCSQTGTLLVFDEVQTGFGRLGRLFAFEKYGVVPDILTVAKSMGGGMPLGAFISSKTIMDSLQTNPALGHITTFGGHPVSCAAGLAALDVILSENLISSVESKAGLFRKLLKDSDIEDIRGEGLLMAVELGKAERLSKFIRLAYENGIATDWFLFNNSSFRIAPPLIINDSQIEEACEILKTVLKTLGR
ncbi:MAG: aspartate aminotransferase family protein [Prevotellaceae bacterium]|jgi:acetylornithine/succinyldiaminopimelate/putrescine aminotransferase|nr:aspartate aminotransferase family protein [Prevotellaceae bacterium]